LKLYIAIPNESVVKRDIIVRIPSQIANGKINTMNLFIKMKIKTYSIITYIYAISK